LGTCGMVEVTWRSECRKVTQLGVWLRSFIFGPNSEFLFRFARGVWYWDYSAYRRFSKVVNVRYESWTWLGV
jgi:hypothetical protein